MTRECITHHICDCQAERLRKAEAFVRDCVQRYAGIVEMLAAVEAERDVLRGLLSEWVDPDIDGISREELIRQSFAAIKGYHDNLK